MSSGVSDECIYFVGNVMIDMLLKNMPRLRRPDIWKDAHLEPGHYVIMTLHRPANVDEEEKLKVMLDEIIQNSRGLPLVFPVHPRTAKQLQKLGVKSSNLHMIEPLGYLEFNYLVRYAKVVLTDSGGISEETTVMGVPCMTLRDNTERPETVTIGTNELIGTDPRNIAPAFDRLVAGEWKKGSIPNKWDGKASERIVDILLHRYNCSCLGS